MDTDESEKLIGVHPRLSAADLSFACSGLHCCIRRTTAHPDRLSLGNREHGKARRRGEGWRGECTGRERCCCVKSRASRTRKLAARTASFWGLRCNGAIFPLPPNNFWTG